MTRGSASGALISASIAFALISGHAAAGPCYPTSLRSISKEEFFFKREFGRIGLLRPDNRVAELTRYTCYDLSPLRRAGSMRVVFNPFVANDPADLLVDKPLYVGLQVVSIRPNIGRSRVHFWRNKNSKAHAGIWAVPRKKWQSAHDVRGRAAAADLSIADFNDHLDSSADVPEGPVLPGQQISGAVEKFQNTADPDQFQALSGNWHAWIVSRAKNGKAAGDDDADHEDSRGSYIVHADTWEDAQEWRLNDNEINRLVAGHSVTIRNYLHLLTPMKIPDGAQNQATATASPRRVVFDVPIAEASCIYIRPISSADIQGRIPIDLVKTERFIAFTRSSEYNCPGPDEYPGYASYYWNRFLGR
jgi:hypothetical protein